MLEAIAYGSMLENIKEHKTEQDTIGILLTRPTSKAGKDIVGTLPYYHHRSGRSINFYLPGYGAYWYGAYPDEKNVAVIDGANWSFSNQKYVEFIEALENHSKWKYSGESELLLIGYADGKLDHSKVLKFHLDASLLLAVCKPLAQLPFPMSCNHAPTKRTALSSPFSFS